MNYEQEIINLKKRIEELEKALFEKKEIKSQDTTTSNRDKTKYMYEGKVYPKNRLVLAIVKRYVRDNNPTFDELSNIFDKSLQGSLGVIESYKSAVKISDASKRFFIKEDDIIRLQDEDVVVCTQWGIFNIVKFVKRAQALGYNIETI